MRGVVGTQAACGSRHPKPVGKDRHIRGNMEFTRAFGRTPEIEAAIDNAFEYHRWNEEQTAHGVEVRKALVEAVKVIVEHVPPSADRSAAIRKIREARMDANSAITHGGKF